jgi:hypothetical protein
MGLKITDTVSLPCRRTRHRTYKCDPCPLGSPGLGRFPFPYDATLNAGGAQARGIVCRCQWNRTPTATGFCHTYMQLAQAWALRCSFQLLACGWSDDSRGLRKTGRPLELIAARITRPGVTDAVLAEIFRPIGRQHPHHEVPWVAEQLQNATVGFVKNFSKMYPQSTHQDRQYVMGYYPAGFLPGRARKVL